jgi:gliding motility-associated-like protein
VLTLSTKPTAPSVTNGSGCGTSVSVALSAAGATNGQYRWYTTSSEALPIAGEANSTFNTPLLNATTTYYVVINNGGCESTRIAVTATITPSCGQNSPPVINTVTATTQLEGSTTVDLLSLVSDLDNNFNPASLTVVQAPTSGAIATITNNGLLTLNYAGTSFSGEDKITIQACDFLSSCTQQVITVTVVGDLVIYNALSPNGDNKNEFLFLQHIDVLPSTRENNVTIFNRWGDVVFNVDNYNNAERSFSGRSNDDKELVTGTYYYKITFRSGRATQTGFLYLKR